MSEEQRPRYSPLPPDGEWTTDASWAEVTSLLADPSDARRALDALRRIFPPRRVCGFEGARLHPLELDYLQCAARVDLIELGLALADLKPRRAAGRLRNPLEYRTARAELQAGLMLHRMGATVEHEPTGAKTGPDWLASWPAGRIGVEVKCLATSRNAEALMLVDFHFNIAFMAALEGVRPSEPAWLTTSIDPALVDELVFAGQLPRRERIEALGTDAAEHAKRNLPVPTAAGTYSMGRAGTFEIALGAPGEPRFHLQGRGLERDQAHESDRVYQEVQRAAAQLRALDLPGLIVLDMGRDGLLTNQYTALRELLEVESWAAHLAGAVFVDRFAAGTGRSHTVLHVVPGTLVEALDHTFGSGVIVCDAGHRHAPGLLRAVEPCDCRL